MAVQNWIDILRLSKKTALINDGEFNELQTSFLTERITVVYSPELVLFCLASLIFINSDSLLAFQLTLILPGNKQVAPLALLHITHVVLTEIDSKIHTMKD